MPILLLTLSGVLTLAGFLSQHGWWFDLASHFRVQYAVIQLLCLILCLVLKRKKWLVVTAFFLVLNLSQILPLYFSPHIATTDGPKTDELKILFINVNSANTEYEKTAQHIKKTNPDVLALEEVNQVWFDRLSGVLESFPHRKFVLRGDNFGIGFFSKIPLTKMAIEYYGSAEVPSVLATLLIGNKPVDIIFTHTVPPVSQRYFQWRNEQLSAVASLRAKLNESLIVIGDLNTTSWSYYFKDFIERMKLYDSRQGHGIQISWPAMMPLLGIAIDHCLVSRDIRVLDRKIGPAIGSDHYPVYVELQVGKGVLQ